MDTAPSGAGYLPRTRRMRAVRRIMTAPAYRVWRRKLSGKAGFGRHGKRVLFEIGSGPGYFLSRLRRWFPDSLIIGSDVDRACVLHAASEAPGAAMVRSDALELPVRTATLDLVSALQVIEHVSSPERFLAEARRVLKLGGILLLSTPNPEGIGARLLKDKWQGFHNDHISLRKPGEWRAAAVQAGFRVLDLGTTGLTGIPLLKIPPFSLLNWIPMGLLGYFPWLRGESLMMICAAEERPPTC